MKLAALQQAIYARLTADATLSGLVQAVYIPKAPQAEDGQLTAPFPYVVVPQITATPQNTDTTRGANIVVQVDAYSRSQSDLEINRIGDALYNALHRVALAVTGATWVTTEHENSVTGWEDDGKTRRIISLYRVMLDGV